MLVPRLIHTWITVQRGGKQGRAHTSSNGEDSYLSEIRQSREMQNWEASGLHGLAKPNHMWKRWDERLWGARRFHHFCEDFHRLLLCVCLCLLVCFWVGVVWWLLSVLFSLCWWKTPASNSCFTSFCYSSEVDRLSSLPLNARMKHLMSWTSGSRWSL